MTPEDFVAWEREQPERYEFFDGEVLARVGGTLAHSAIVDNVQAALRAMLVGRGCRVLQSNAKVADVPVGRAGARARPPVPSQRGAVDVLRARRHGRGDRVRRAAGAAADRRFLCGHRGLDPAVASG
jgi:hypothetical protein